MLAIPLMKAEGHADVSSLERVLKNQRAFPEDQIINDCRRLDAIRKEAIAVHDPNELTQGLLLQYFYQLRSLIPRLQPFENEVQLNFHWLDAFVVGRKGLSSSLYFEMACILWNLGAFESMRGAKEDRSTDEGIRAAGRYFQQAAGYFDYLKEQILPSLPQTVMLQCLSNDCLNMTKNLMLAQGQLCFYEKAVRELKRLKSGMKAGIVAKLGAQTSVFYQTTAACCRTGTLGSILDVSWFAISDFQAKCFHGAGEYWQAVTSKSAAAEKGSGYGEEVTRYNRAEGYVRQAIEIGKRHNVLSALTAGAENLLSIITTNRANAIKDLNTIYMETPPNEGSVPEVIGVAMVKPSNLPEISLILPSTDVLLFKFILPRAIVDATNRFYQEIQQVIGNTSINSENATNIGRSTLSSVNLPGALEGIKVENNIPMPLWNKILKIQSMGGIERLKSLVMELSNSSKRAANSITILEDAIQSEEQKDHQFFQQFPVYNGTRSSLLDVDIKNNLQLLKDDLKNAQVNDENITKELIESTTENRLLLLTKTREELLKLFPTQQSMQEKVAREQEAARAAAAAAAPPKVVDLLDLDEFNTPPPPPPPPVANNSTNNPENLLGPDGVALEVKLHDLAELFERRIKETDRLKTFQSINVQDTVQQTFLSVSSSGSGGDSSAAVQEILDRHLQEIHSIRGLIESGFQQQEALLQEILQLNEKFTKHRESNPLIMEKNRFLVAIEESINKYFGLHSQVTAGQTFYLNLQSKLTTLQQNLDDLAYTQQWQRQEYEKDQVEEHNRYEQEQRDRELAMKLANELNIQQPPPPPPPSAANTGVPLGAAVAGMGVGGVATMTANNNNYSVMGYGTTTTANSLGGPAMMYQPAPPTPAVATATPYSMNPAVNNAGAVPRGPPVVATGNNNNPNNPGGIVYGTPVAGPPAGYHQYTSASSVGPAPVPATTAVPVTTAGPSAGYQPANYSNYNNAAASASINYATTSGAYNPHAVPPPQPQQPQPGPGQPYGGAPTNYLYGPTNPPPGAAVPVTQPGTANYHHPGQPVPVPTAQPSNPPPAAQRNLSSQEMESKVSRVMEMGFPRDQVFSALSQAGWEEETAINILLGVETPAPAPPAAVQPTNPPPAANNNASRGGFFWGRK